MPLALEHLRVVDASQGIPGAICAMQLADLGANTIKVEPPGGDWLREIGPFLGDESALFVELNRNKRGIAVDLKTDDGKEILHDLLVDADVFIEGYRPGVMDRLGFAYENVSPENPRLVYCSITSHGRTGPLAGAPATELDVQAMVGMNRHLGSPSLPPVRFGFDLVSHNAGVAGFQGIMAALFWRERTGEGQHIDTSLLAAAVAINQWTYAGEYAGAHDPTGNEIVLGAMGDPPDHGFMTADGPVLLNLGRSEQSWQLFLIAVDEPEALADSRFSNLAARSLSRNRLADVLDEKLSNWRYEDLRRLVQDELGGTIVRLNDMELLAEDSQVQALGIIRDIPGHATLGTVKALNVPWTFDEEIAALRFAAPVLGQHTADVLAELGYSRQTIERLAADRVVGVFEADSADGASQ